MVKVLLLILYMTLTVLAQDSSTVELGAPFGLKWGAKHVAKKCEIKNQELNKFILCSTSRVPKPVKDIERYTLIYANKKLVKVTAYSFDFNEDYYGHEGVELYTKFKTLLTAKYLEPGRSLEQIGMYVFRKTSEFYECLGYPDCGMYSSIWSFPNKDPTVEDGTIILKLEGFGKGKGFLVIIYEHPSFYQFLKEREFQEDKVSGESL